MVLTERIETEKNDQHKNQIPHLLWEGENECSQGKAVLL